MDLCVAGHGATAIGDTSVPPNLIGDFLAANDELLDRQTTTLM
ncbi:hypothetical protein [Lentzea sp. NEAU-D7]|nr:hypothetical protein [Lentzea sp. NEAU-D7]